MILQNDWYELGFFFMKDLVVTWVEWLGIKLVVSEKDSMNLCDKFLRERNVELIGVPSSPFLCLNGLWAPASYAGHVCSNSRFPPRTCQLTTLRLHALSVQSSIW